MNHKKDYCINRYFYNGKEYLEVTIQKRDKNGKMLKRKSRFTKNNHRITSLRAAEDVKFWLREKLNLVINSDSSFSWSTWLTKALDIMRKSGLKESTILTYTGLFSKWADPSWEDKNLASFTRDDIYEYIHNYLKLKEATDWTRQNISKKLHRIFEMALDNGIIAKNPVKGIKVDAQSDEGKVLTSYEVGLLLSKAKEIDHDFYFHWAMALMTGMRSGELFALCWSCIDFEKGLIHVSRQFTSKDGVHLPKRGKIRVIDMSEALRSFLIDLKKRFGPILQKMWHFEEERQVINAKPVIVKVKKYQEYNDLVLPRVRAWQMGMQAKALKEFCQKIGITPIQFHDLRATYN